MNKTWNTGIFIVSVLGTGWIITTLIAVGVGNAWDALFNTGGVPAIPAGILILGCMFFIAKFKIHPYPLMIGSNVQKKIFNMSKSAQNGFFVICVLLFSLYMLWRYMI